MKKYQLFSEFNNATIYGETLEDAIMHATIKSHQEGMEIEIKKVLGYDDTNKATRGNHNYESVIIETKDGKRLSIDARYIGEIS